MLRLFLSVWLFLVLNSLIAQKINYQYRKYDISAGIPSSEVYCVLKDKRGFMWFGTDAGVSRFDGYQFSNYSRQDGLTDNTIFSLYEDCLGRIWYLSFTGGIGYIYKDTIRPYRFNEELKLVLGSDTYVNWIIVDSTMNIRFTTALYGYGTISSSGSITFEKTAKTPQDQLVVSEKNGMVTSHFLKGYNSPINESAIVRWCPETGDDVFHTVKLPSDSSRIISVGNPNFYMIVGKGKYHTILYVDKDTIMTLKMQKEVRGVFKDQSGRIWLHRFNEGAEIYSNINSLFSGDRPVLSVFPGFNISGMLNDEAGAAWMTVENSGVYYLQNMFIENFSFEYSEQKNKITSLAKNDNGDIFYTNEYGDIYKVTKKYNHELILSGATDITQVYFADYSDLYFACITKSSSGQHKKIVPHSGKYKFHCVNARLFLVNNNRDIMQVIGTTLMKFRNGERVFSSSNLSERYYYHCIFEDFDGDIWLGTKQGLFYFKNDSLHRTRFTPDFDYNDVVRAIGQLSDSTLFIATDSYGIVFFNKKQNNSIEDVIDLQGKIVTGVHLDSNQDIWVASHSGLAWLKKSNDGYSVQHLTEKQGLPSNEVNAIISDGDVIFVATNAGLSVFDKQRVKTGIHQPLIYIQSVLANDQKMDQKDLLHLQQDQNYLVFKFIGLSYRNAGEIRYRYKLEGIDDHWKYTKSTSVHYPHLPPGNYTFSVMACNEDHIWGKEVNVAIVINPPFWQKSWFIGCLVFLFSGITMALIKRRNKRHELELRNSQQITQHKIKTFEAELKALRAQMNPHFTFNVLNSIQNTLTGIHHEKAADYISDFSLLMRKVLENSGNKLISVAEELEMLSLYLKLENLRFDNSIQYNITVDTFIDREYQQIPSMIIQPFVENAIIHGLSAKREGNRVLSVSLEFQQGFIKCIIEDNGIGRLKAAELRKKNPFVTESMGIQIVQKQLDILFENFEKDPSLEITDIYTGSGMAKGTRVEFFLYEVSNTSVNSIKKK